MLQVDNVSRSEKNALFFICEYIAKKEGLPTDSDDIVIDDKAERNSNSEFVSLVSRGKFTIPPTELFAFALFIYAIFKNLKLITCRKRLARICQIIYDSFLFTFPAAPNVIRRFVNTFFNGFVKERNDSTFLNNQKKKQKLI